MLYSAWLDGLNLRSIRASDLTFHQPPLETFLLNIQAISLVYAEE